MRRNGLNLTNGVFDINKESRIVADIVVDALMYPKMITKEDSDRASNIAAAEFLAFRERTDVYLTSDEAKIDDENKMLASMIIDAFIAASILKTENISLAYEIAKEEILVQRFIETDI